MQFYGRMQHFFDEQNKTITINEGFTQFQNYNIAKNLSEKTINHYQMCFDIFAKFYDTKKPCYSITENTIFEYIVYLKANRNINDVTLGTYLRHVRTLFYYFMKQGYITPFPISIPKAVKKIKETYKVPLLGAVPCFCEVLKAEGNYLFPQDKPDHPFTRLLYEMANKIEKNDLN